MRDHVDQYLVVAMAIAEACRGVRDVLSYVRHQRKQSRSRPTAQTFRQVAARHVERVIVLALVLVATTPVLYYSFHASAV